MELSLSPEQLILLSQLGVSLSLLVFLYLASKSDSPLSSAYLLPLFLVVWMTLSTSAQAADQQPIPTIERGGLVLPDWSKITFDSLPAMSEAGSLKVGADVVSQLGFDPSASWQAGSKVGDVIKLGGVQDLGVGNLSQGQIDKLIGQSSQNLSLDKFAPAQLQTLGSMSEAVPGLKDLQVGQVAPVSDLIKKGLPNLDLSSLGGAGGFTGGDISQLPIGDFLQKVPQAESLAFQSLDLSKYKISQVPGIDLSKLSSFKDWESVLLKGIPGLGQVPLNKLPNMQIEGPQAVIARMDVPLDQADKERQRSVSGSYKEGFRVPCTSNCAHGEVTPLQGSQMLDGKDFLNGRQWISGKHQQVSGGNGLLSAVNGGKEPTGRNPYGSVFKQVITKIDQKKGQIQTSMYFRVCKRDAGCTPYILGPLPFLNYQEKQMIYLGEGNPKDDGKGLEYAQSEDTLSGQDGFEPDCGTTLSGEAVDKAVAVTDPAYRNRAKTHIPTIMAALKKEGITDPAQVAYVLGTVERESRMGLFMKELDCAANASAYGYNGGARYCGRGYVQLTHKYNYEKFSKTLGVDLVNNPDLAQRPDIAARILAIGMKRGDYTGAKLSDYISGNKVDFYNARDVVNGGKDAASEIAGYSKRYYDAIKSSDLSKLKEGTGCAGGELKKTNGYINPLRGQSYSITSEQGPRNCPFHGPETHAGIDMGAGVGTPISAVKEGKARVTPSNCGGPHEIEISHPDGNMTRYLHLNSHSVSNGQTVQQGQRIGTVGSMGACTTGPHLHYEFYKGGQVTNPRRTGAKF